LRSFQAESWQNKKGRWKVATTFGAGLPDFSLSNIPKRKKYTKLPQTIPKGHKLYQMAVKYS
jgi:hypothetical protein